MDGVGEDASHVHAPLYPCLLGIHGTVWGFGLILPALFLLREPNCKNNDFAFGPGIKYPETDMSLPGNETRPLAFQGALC